jgi:cell division protein FtsW
MAPFRVERLLAFLNPWEHMDKAGWHVVQSLLAIGRGGLFGVGLGGGVQKFGYLPEDTTDFIFAALCEEMGLLGGILVIGVFAVFVWRGARVVKKAPDSFGFLLASGLLLTIALQAIMNIGVVSGALPCKGIGLPFLSYGGTGLVVMSLAAGLLASVARGAERGVASPKGLSERFGTAALGGAERQPDTRTAEGGGATGLSRIGSLRGGSEPAPTPSRGDPPR